MRRLLLLCLVILAACTSQTAPTTVPTPTREPVGVPAPATAVPAQSEEALRLQKIFQRHGFVISDRDYGCGKPCTWYENDDLLVLGAVSSEGYLGLVTILDDNSGVSGADQAELDAGIIASAYPLEVMNWIAKHVDQLTIDSPITGTVGEHTIYLKELQAENAKLMIIEIYESSAPPPLDPGRVG